MNKPFDMHFPRIFHPSIRRAPLSLERVECTDKCHTDDNYKHDPRGFDWITYEEPFCFDCGYTAQTCVASSCDCEAAQTLRDKKPD